MKNNILILGAAGYIGSALSMHFPEAELWDTKWYGKDRPKNTNIYWKNEIEKYNTIIYLAGLSSVSSCSNLYNTLKNNVVHFDDLLKNIRNDQKLIYASSGSVYGDNDGKFGNENSNVKHSLTNYDMGMLNRESLCKKEISAGKKIYGLRFGTVAGCLDGQKNIRDNTAINGMVKSAIINNYIDVSKHLSFRAFVDIKDICGFVEAIVESNSDPGIYNVVSFNSMISDISYHICKYFNVKYNDVKGDNPYNFRMSTSKMKSIYKPKGTLKKVIEDLDRNRKNLIYTEWKEWKGQDV